MSTEHLPPTGSIKVVKPKKAAKLVEQVARDTEDPDVATEQLLIVLDIDGTVILQDESLSPGVVEAVEHAHRAGHEVMIATGRSWEGTRGILQRAEDRAGVRGLLERRGRAQEDRCRRSCGTSGSTSRRSIPAEVLTQLREHLPDAKYLVELPDGEPAATPSTSRTGTSPTPRASTLRASSPRSRCAASSSSPPTSTSRTSSTSCRGSGSTRCRTRSDGRPGSTSRRRASTRAPGSRSCATELGIDPAHVLVIGDGRNDVGMFRWAREKGGRAVAMEQGPQEVRDAAGETTTSVEAGGVAAVLRKL